jgi:hypothetical protein
MDLVVWYLPEGEICGFQLCYDRGSEERALTWTPERGYVHSRVDDGERDPLSMKMTPILVPDGVFDSASVLEQFESECAELPHEVARFVTNRLRECRAPDR